MLAVLSLHRFSFGACLVIRLSESVFQSTFKFKKIINEWFSSSLDAFNMIISKS